MYNKKAKFITFEGGEGSGKTTYSKKLYDYLISQNIPVILTREIGGTMAAENIRKIIVNQDLLSTSELMLIMAARFEHVNKVIIPALKNGNHVICDRFIDSTLAYQGQDIENGFDLILNLHIQLVESCFSKIGRSFMPDITFFLDLPPEIALSRTKNRNDNNKFEAKPLSFHINVYEQFKAIANKFPDRIVSITSSNCSIKEMTQMILT